jgi:Ca2+-transporting ATPase
MSLTVPSSSVPPSSPAGHPSWWRVPAADVAEAMDVDPAVGLAPAEVERRRSEVGPNKLAEPPVRPRWKKFLDQFRSGIVYILIGAAVLAGLVGDLKDPIVIAFVLLVNAILGYVQEARAESAMAALEKMLVARVKVRRGGTLEEVSTEDLVPGDVVMLEAGDRVPADGRLLVAVNASIDESALTGESVPVDKDVEPITAPDGHGDSDGGGDLPLGERTNLAYMNTTVVRGRAELLVTDTGMATEMGRVAELLNEGDPGPTPLQRQLDVLGKRLALIAVVAVSLVFVLQLVQGESFADAAIGAVALAVAAIPEGLPAVVTVTLAIGVSQMAKRNAIVKRLHSVETLGSTTVICSDKTGTLTLNRMTVREVVGDRDAGLRAGSLCNDAALDPEGGYVGDPTEGAIVVAAAEDGIDVVAERAAHPRIGEVPFDSATKFMATYHRDGDEVVVHAKGAPDVLLPRCAARRDDDGLEQAIDADAVHADNHALASEGLRVLAVASRRLDASDVLDGDGTVADPDRWVDGLTLDALVGIVDPPRAEARDAIALCRSAGIDVKMITGDHAATATAIARELGIEGRVVTGDELERMTDEELAAEIDGIGACARVSPEHKVRVVRALQSNGHVVAMTGDGVNDAAALRNADIGVAMGITGTEVTKEAGDMVLADDNFATIVGAVERGRTIYDNIVKFVRFQLTTNLGAIATILSASLIGLPVPFTAVQVLWVNIIADGPPAMTLGIDPPPPNVMDRAPRSQSEAILTPRKLVPMIFGAVVMAVGTLGLYVYAEGEWGEEVALTMTFTTFVLFQMANVFNARVPQGSVISRYTLTNGKVWIAVGIVVALQVLATKWGPMQSIFDTETLSLEQWLLCLAVAVSIIPLDEARKVVTRLLTRGSADDAASATATPASTPTA